MSERAIAAELGVTRSAVRRLLEARSPVFLATPLILDAVELLFDAPGGQFARADEEALAAAGICLDLAAVVDAGEAPAVVAEDIERVALMLVEGWAPADNPLVGILLRRSLRRLGAEVPGWLLADRQASAAS